MLYLERCKASRVRTVGRFLGLVIVRKRYKGQKLSLFGGGDNPERRPWEFESGRKDNKVLRRDLNGGEEESCQATDQGSDQDADQATDQATYQATDRASDQAHAPSRGIQNNNGVSGGRVNVERDCSTDRGTDRDTDGLEQDRFGPPLPPPDLTTDRVVLYVARNLLYVIVPDFGDWYLAPAITADFCTDNGRGRETKRCQRLTAEIWADIWRQAVEMESRWFRGEVELSRFELLAQRVLEIRDHVDSGMVRL